MRTFHPINAKGHHLQHQSPRLNPTMRVLMIVGIVVLCTCLLYPLDWAIYLHESIRFIEIDLNVLKQSSIAQFLDNDWQNLILILAIPTLGLIGTLFLSDRHPKVSKVTAYIFGSMLLIITICLQFARLVSQTQETFLVHLGFFTPSILLLASALKFGKKGLLLMATVSFYCYIFALILNDGINPIEILSLVLVYSTATAWVSSRIGYPGVNLLLMVLALTSYGSLWFKNFFIDLQPSLPAEYFAFSLLFYFLFYAIEIYAAYTGPRPLKHWIQLVFSWINFLVFLGTSSYVMISLYDLGILWLFALVLLRVNVFGLKLINRFQPRVWALPQYYIIITLVSLIIPLLFRQNIVLLFTGGLSISMLVYANAFRDKPAMWFSLGSMATMIGLYALSWMNSFLPAMLSNQIIPDIRQAIFGTVTGLMTIASLSLTQWLLNKVEIPFSGKWFKRSTYYRLIRGLRLIALFLTFEWVSYSFLCLFSKSVSNTPVICFIAGSLYFIIMLKYYAKTNSGLKQKMFFFALVFSITYPILVQWTMTNVRNDLINSGDLDLWAIPLHYVALILFVYLGFTIFSYLSRFHLKSAALESGIGTLIIFFAIFLGCTEYDNISMIISAIANNMGGNYIGGNELLNINHHLPYSVVIWLLVIVVYFRAISRHNLYLRNIAVVLMAGVITKIFAFDFDELNTLQRNGVIFGLSMILIVLVYSATRRHAFKAG